MEREIVETEADTITPPHYKTPEVVALAAYTRICRELWQANHRVLKLAVWLCFSVLVNAILALLLLA